MQAITNIEGSNNDTQMRDLSIEDKQRLVDVFGWLIQEDKKQNPAFYQVKKSKK